MIVPSTPVGPTDVADHYDELDRFYRELWGEHLHHGLWRTRRESTAEATDRLVALVADRAGVDRGSRVCDLGCGYGATARWLHARHAAHVVGITLSRVQFERARAATAPGGPCFVHGDWLLNELPERSFDAVIALESTEHIGDKRRCFAEARRVLRPGGRLVVCAWLAGDRPRGWQVDWLLEPICREGRIPGLARADEYVAWLAGSGLRPRPWEELSAGVARTWSICAYRLLRRLLRDRAARDYLRSRASRHRAFALSVARIRLAYACGAMRYGLFVAERPPAS
ncbi:MAG TPA: methyltransferase domain-containing protein [Candidatus Polarisedimenticolaceae bacterium]|nr:methyltransferase domain-containing protein [Candidatus Polarisedimenticolaceae bacterium]